MWDTSVLIFFRDNFRNSGFAQSNLIGGLGVPAYLLRSAMARNRHDFPLRAARLGYPRVSASAYGRLRPFH